MASDDPTDPLNQALRETEDLRLRVAELERRVASRGSEPRVPIANRDTLSAREALLVEAERIAGVGSWVWNVSTNDVLWSDQLFRILGYDANCDRASTEAFFDRVHPDDVARIREISARSSTSGISERAFFRVVRPDGSIRYAQMDGAMVFDEDGNVSRIVGTVLDITEAKRTADELRRIATELEEAQEVAGVGSWEWEGGTVVRGSPQLLRIIGHGPGQIANAESFVQIVHEADRPIYEAMRESARAGRDFRGELRIVRADGEMRNVYVVGRAIAPSRYRGTALDITERVRLDAELRQSQKIEAIGRLAGGVAHDFNNSLAVILANIELLRRHHRSPEVDEIELAARGAASLTKQLLAFGRRAVIAVSTIDVNATVQAGVTLLRRVIGENIDIRLELDPDVGMVKADAGQLQQMLVNLALNARDAMPSGGTLRIVTANRMIDEAYVKCHRDASIGEHVMIAVEDSGAGMDDETLAHAFEPFFTTKDIGKGTGLGLAMVFGGVKQSGGSITVRSAPGRGTEVCMFLPRAQPTDRIEPRSRRGPKSTGLKKILVVEDEPAVARAVERMLVDAGFEVLVAPRPSVARAIVAEEGERISLVISDVMMPEMSGHELARCLLALRPALKILFMSGYLSGHVAAEASQLGGILQKPFTIDELLDRVRALTADVALVPSTHAHA